MIPKRQLTFAVNLMDLGMSWENLQPHFWIDTDLNTEPLVPHGFLSRAFG